MNIYFSLKLKSVHVKWILIHNNSSFEPVSVKKKCHADEKK